MPRSTTAGSYEKSMYYFTFQPAMYEAFFCSTSSPAFDVVRVSYFSHSKRCVGFPGSSDGKESAYNAGDPGSIPGSGRSPGEGNGNPLQYSCLKNSMDRGAWQATVLGLTELNMTENT